MKSADELRMHIVVNADAKMDKGKIAAQVGHAVQLVTEYMLHADYGLYYYGLYSRYNDQGMVKIVHKADAATMANLTKKTKFVVHDAGRTQIEAGTLTAVAFLPMTDEDRNTEFPELEHLKLL